MGWAARPASRLTWQARPRACGRATRVLTYDNVITGGFGGAEQESLWKWTLAGTGNWVFNFGASAAHMSLDQIAVYAVQQAPAVPEPQTWALMGAGLGAMALVRRRRQAR